MSDKFTEREIRNMMTNTLAMMPDIKFFIASKEGEKDLFIPEDSLEEAQEMADTLKKGYTVREVTPEEFLQTRLSQGAAGL